MRQRRRSAPGMSLSLLDMLFSTFGAVILLAFVFSAMINDLPVLEANNFYHMNAKFYVANKAPLNIERQTGITVELSEKDSMQAFSLDGALLTGDSIYAKHSPALSIYISRSNAPSGLYTEDIVDVIYHGDLPIGESLSYKVKFINQTLGGLCSVNRGNDLVTVEIREQVGAVRKAPVEYQVKCSDIPRLLVQDTNFINNLNNTTQPLNKSTDIETRGDIL